MVQTVQQISQSTDQVGQDRKYFKVQLRAWTNFDPTDMELAEIAEAIENGSGFVSVIEVTRVAPTLAEIDDPEIRRRFAIVHAAQRLVENIHELPKSLQEKLYAALERSAEQSAARNAA